MDGKTTICSVTGILCPACGGRELRPVAVGGDDRFLCPGCGACWRRGAAVPVRMERVDPLTCRGCRARRVCLAALAERSP